MFFNFVAVSILVVLHISLSPPPLLTNLDCMQLRLNNDGHIIGTEYLSDLVEKEHAEHKHGNCLGAHRFFWSKICLSCNIDHNKFIFLLRDIWCLVVAMFNI